NRLESGLVKLQSCARQVDDLKDKLAAQEVELKQKNEDADKLIKVSFLVLVLNFYSKTFSSYTDRRN
ncbi:unnamed protein product, partial [Rotaria magnacalcarata]